MTPVRAYGGTLILYTLLIMTALVFVVPLFWVFSASLKDTQQIYTFPPVWIPSEPRFANYSEAWNAAPFAPSTTRRKPSKRCGQQAHKCAS